MESAISDAQIGQMIFRAISDESSRSTDSFAGHEASLAELEVMEKLKAGRGGTPEFENENQTFRPVQTKRLNTQTMDSGYFETGNQVHPSMIIPGILQTAELKASLESKIAMLTEKIKELTSHPLEDMTNRRITAMEQLQSQQIQVQNMLLEQMKQSNQLVRQQLCGDFQVNSAEPRLDIPRPRTMTGRAGNYPDQRLRSAPPRPTDHISSEDFNIDWLDEVSPLPVRPSSPVKIGQSQPIKICHEKPVSAFSGIETELEEVSNRRRLLDENLKKQKRSDFTEDEYLDEKPIKLKVSKAISEAKARVPAKLAKQGAQSRFTPTTRQTVQQKIPPKNIPKRPVRAQKSTSVEFTDQKLKSIYGRAEWQNKSKRLGRNPYIYHESPPKHHTNVQISQGIHVRSSKSQTTPRLGLERGESAIQIAPPVRAGPSSRNQVVSPETSTASISTSEVLSSTPIPSMEAEVVDRSQNTSQMATTEPTNTQPYSSVETQPTLISDSRQPPVIIKPAYEFQRPASPKAEDRVDELKGWLEREFMSKFIQDRVKEPPVVPPRHHEKQPQDERLLRKLVEDRVRKYLREMRRQKTPPTPEVVKPKAEPLVVSQTYLRPMTPSPIQSFKSPTPFELEPYIDDTLPNISTPEPSHRSPPTPSIPEQNNTLENLPVDESDESFNPILRKSESEGTISSFTAGYTPELSIAGDAELEDLSASQIITPGVSTKSMISINSLDGKSSPTPIRSSTPGKSVPQPELEPRSPSLKEEPQDVPVEPDTIHVQSEESTLCTSTDATFSPGELIISFGEYRAPKTLPLPQKQQKKNGDSLSEGEIECSANDVSSITSRSFSEGEIRYRVKKSQNPNAISAPFEETISEESEDDDPTDLQPDNSLSDQSN